MPAVALTPHPRLGTAIAVTSAFFIAAATLTPAFGAAAPLPWNCFTCGELAVTDALLNVVLFVPLAFGLRLAGMRTWHAVAVAAAASLTIELLQVRAIAGRDASARDVLTNTLGGWAGAALAGARGRLLRPARDDARRLLAAWAAGWVLVTVTGALALQPRAPSPPYLVRWAPALREHAHFPGTVLDARAQGAPLADGLLDDAQAAAIARAMNGGELRVEARVVAGAPPRTLAPVVTVSAYHRLLFTMGQRGRALVVRVPMRASQFRLRTPAVALDGVFGATGDSAPRIVAAEARPGRVTLAARAGTAAPVRDARVRISPVDAWALLIPFEMPLTEDTRGFGIAWLTAFLLPLGYWAAAAARARGRAIGQAGLPWGIVGTTLLASHVVTARATGLSPADGTTWIASVVLVLAGAAIQARVARHRTAPAAE